jgi:photosystem II stability/assembly factor-like uncharacterized protein
MVINSKLIVAAITATMLLVGCGRATVPVVNYNDIGFTTASKKPTLAQVKKAILTAAETKGWIVNDKGPGKMDATLTVRGKHTIIVLITYTTSSFSINYVDSIDMKYGVKHGEPSIHPFYNDWVKELEETIAIELKQV